VVIAGSEQVAILSDEATGEVRRLRPGEAYEDWTLEIVDTRTVAFAKGDERHTFKMFQPGSNPAPVPGARTPVPDDESLTPGPVEPGEQGQREGEFQDGFQPEPMAPGAESPPPEAQQDAEGEQNLDGTSSEAARWSHP
jgi:hypothetical protein